MLGVVFKTLTCDITAQWSTYQQPLLGMPIET